MSTALAGILTEINSPSYDSLESETYATLFNCILILIIMSKQLGMTEYP